MKVQIISRSVFTDSVGIVSLFRTTMNWKQQI